MKLNRLIPMIFVMSVAIVSLGFTPLFAVEKEMTIYVTKDAYTNSEDPDMSFSFTDYIYVSSSNNPIEKNRMYLYFDLSAISAMIPDPVPSADYIEKATLRMRNGSINYETYYELLGNISPVTSTWSDYLLTWNNSPSLDESSGVIFTIPKTGYGTYWEWYEVDITSIVKSWLDGHMMNNGICLRGGTADTSATRHTFYSSDNSAGELLCPRIVISFASGPHRIYGHVFDYSNDTFLSGVKITLSGDGSDVAYSAGPDFYYLYVYDGTYTLKSEKPGYVFLDAEKSVTVSGGNRLVDFGGGPINNGTGGTYPFRPLWEKS